MSPASCTAPLARTVAALLAVAVALSTQVGLAQDASLFGIVRTDPGERPLANAEVAIPALKRSARSDSAGNYKITGVLAGKHEVVIRLVGYETIRTTLEFEPNDKIEGDVQLRLLTTELAAVHVNAAPTRLNLRLVEFEENRKTLTGSFITADVFEKEASGRLSDVVTRRIPGLRVSPIGSRVSSAALMSGRQKGCFVQVIVDGLVQYQQGLERN